MEVGSCLFWHSAEYSGRSQPGQTQLLTRLFHGKWEGGVETTSNSHPNSKEPGTGDPRV